MKTKFISYSVIALLCLAGIVAFKDTVSDNENAHQTVMVKLRENLDEQNHGLFKHINIIRPDGTIEVIEFAKETGSERMKMLLHKFNELYHLGYKLTTSNASPGKSNERYVEYVFIK
ncbi:MAG: hypothetical protein H7296_15815 [Bacteroidia bacterium]|nr:hypothetical protein [Bacteroidia bacterium]